MVKNNIPTAEFQAFDNANSAIEFVNLFVLFIFYLYLIRL